jgi:hypothetical protein
MDLAQPLLSRTRAARERVNEVAAGEDWLKRTAPYLDPSILEMFMSCRPAWWFRHHSFLICVTTLVREIWA